jgi:hypothetical protein
MRYVRWEDVVARYPGAAKIPTASDAENFDLAFGQPAEGSIDASLALRYSVPIANTPTLTPFVVRDIAIDLAYWKMAWMSLDKDKEKVLRDSIDARLVALSTGSTTMVGSGGLIAPSLGVWGTHETYPNISGVDCVEDWGVSSLELQAIEDAR